MTNNSRVETGRSYLSEEGEGETNDCEVLTCFQTAFASRDDIEDVNQEQQENNPPDPYRVMERRQVLMIEAPGTYHAYQSDD